MIDVQPNDHAVASFRRENVKRIWDDLIPLMHAHYEELAPYKDVPLDPDKDFFVRADEQGMIRVYSAREAGVLVGYAVYFVRRDIHYKSIKLAQQDLIFVLPARRGRFGIKFIRWCEEQLRGEGVNLIMCHTKMGADFGGVFERLGYAAIDKIFYRRLDVHGN
jgi:hypothetical protein